MARRPRAPRADGPARAAPGARGPGRSAADVRRRSGAARRGARRARRASGHGAGASAGTPVWSGLRRQPRAGAWAQLPRRVRARPVRATERTREALAGHRLAARPYSVSALQKFAACPYQFFLSAICRLAPREEAVPLQQLDPLMRGKIFHRVQAELLRELRDGGHLPLRPASFDVARAVLERVLTRVARDCEEQLAPAIDRVWQSDLETLKADLRGWLHRLAEADTEWEPIL